MSKVTEKIIQHLERKNKKGVLTEAVNPALKAVQKELGKFGKIQRKYKSLGADDTPVDEVLGKLMNGVKKSGVLNISLPKRPEEWKLLPDDNGKFLPKAKEAAKALSAQAKVILIMVDDIVGAFEELDTLFV